MQQLKDDDKFAALVNRHYEQAVAQINRDIDHEFQWLASKSGNSYAEMQKAVDEADIQKLSQEAKKLVEKAEDLRADGKKVHYGDFTKEENARMRLYNATMRVNRLEYLKSEVGLELLDLTDELNTRLGAKLTDSARAEFKRQAGILGEQLGTAKPWISYDTHELIMKSTAGGNWSQRLWQNQDVLKAKLDQVLSAGFISGDSPREMARKLKDNVKSTVGNHRYVTERLVRTETARVQHDVQMDSIKTSHAKYVLWIAEPRACSLCREYAHHRVEGESEVGVYPIDEAPSIPTDTHPNCRCSVAGYYSDAQLDAELEKLGFGSKSNLSDQQVLNKFLNDQLVEKLGQEDAINLARQLERAPAHIQKAWANYADQLKLIGYSESGGSYYSRFPSKGVITNKWDLNLRGDPSFYQKKYDVFFHELGHMIDNLSADKFPHDLPLRGKKQPPAMLKGLLYNSSDLLKETLDADWENLIQPRLKRILSKVELIPDGKGKAQVKGRPGHYVRVKKDGTLTRSAEKSFRLDAQQQLIDDIRKETTDLPRSACSDLSDMLSARGWGYPLGSGHSSNYWKKGYTSPMMTEFFAECTSASINNPESAKLIKKYFPKSWKGYNDIMKELSRVE